MAITGDFSGIFSRWSWLFLLFVYKVDEMSNVCNQLLVWRSLER